MKFNDQNQKEIEISVILVAHDRKPYITTALNSVYNQTIDRAKFEVIVVKNFLDEDIDRIISLYNFNNVFTNEKELTKKLEIGLSESKGKIITILEDDDFYENIRLNIVLNTFSSNSIIFYHNDFKMINGNGHIINKYSQRDNIVFSMKSNNLIQLFNKVIRYRGHHNLSSMAFERCFFEKVINNFQNVTFAVDLIFFLEAISNGGNLFFDCNQLTYYMRHDSASTVLNFNMITNSQVIANDYQTVSVLKKLLNKETNPMLVNKIKLMIIERKIYINIKDPINSDKTKVSIKQLYLFLIEKLHNYNPESYFIISLFFINKISPLLAQSIFRKVSSSDFRVNSWINM